MKKQAELEKKGGEEKDDAEVKEDENTPLSGPTIGRRRDFSSKQTPSGSTDEKGSEEGVDSASAKAKSQQDRMSLAQASPLRFLYRRHNQSRRMPLWKH